ncbi:MAG: hypothetical protein J6386_00955 [Candidatus Synoicihabitans palmerolidicus]|nr:hypothetical protein [Candidatus Synoicihabitans palmerolidicus]
MVVVAMVLTTSVWITWQSARQLRQQQRFVEEGNRQAIGEFLRQHSKPGETVFLEPLGDIGYFSGLRTLDFTGMSSPETVAARQLVGNGWRALIGYLHPDWIVLRPREFSMMHPETTWSLESVYERVAVFDQTADIEPLDVRGKPYLTHDAAFFVFHRRPVISKSFLRYRIESDVDVQPSQVGDRSVVMIHAGGQAWDPRSSR